MESSDREIYEKIVGVHASSSNEDVGQWEVFAAERAELMLAETSKRGLFTRMHCLAYLGAHFRDVRATLTMWLLS